jgi:chemotaxis protein CheD
MSPAAESVVLVRMAEMQVVKGSREHPVVLKTTLGSCVGIILADRQNEVFGLAHVMLPEKLPNDETLGKYADSAVPALVSLMGHRAGGGAGGKLEAFLVGGASMFESGGGAMTDIGNRNVQAAHQAVRKLNIPVVFDDTGGSCGRTVIFDCQRAQLSVKTLKKLEAPRKDPPR